MCNNYLYGPKSNHEGEDLLGKEPENNKVFLGAAESVRSVGPKRKVYFSLGSNMGDRLQNLSLAASAILELDAAARFSPVYETTPVGGPDGQDNYYNLAAEIESAVYPYDLLQFIHEVENTAKRVRKERFGPRTLDVDILLIDGVIIQSDILTIPHPRMHERAFVLAPLSDLVDIKSLRLFTQLYSEFKDTPWQDVLREKNMADEFLHRLEIDIDLRHRDEP